MNSETGPESDDGATEVPIDAPDEAQKGPENLFKIPVFTIVEENNEKRGVFPPEILRSLNGMGVGDYGEDQDCSSKIFATLNRKFKEWREKNGTHSALKKTETSLKKILSNENVRDKPLMNNTLMRDIPLNKIIDGLTEHSRKMLCTELGGTMANDAVPDDPKVQYRRLVEKFGDSISRAIHDIEFNNKMAEEVADTEKGIKDETLLSVKLP